MNLKELFARIVVDRIIKDADIIAKNTILPKYIPTESPKFCVAYRAGAAGEFFSFLILAHESPLWKQRPLCCWLPEYNTLWKSVRNNIAAHKTHSAVNFYIRDKSIPIIHLVCDIPYLTRLRPNKARLLRGVDALKDYNIRKGHIDYFLEDYEDHTNVYDVEINYFNPTDNYYDLCKVLKMKPDINFYCFAWLGYLVFTKVFIKNSRDMNMVDNTIKKLKKELPKGYNGWTYKNF